MKKYPAISRREFLSQMSLLGSLACAYPVTSLAELRKTKAGQAPDEWQKLPEWQTISQVQEILFPAADDVPGASDIGASTYLHNTIENPDADAEDKDFIFRGIGWLDDLTQQRHKKRFIQLTAAQQQQTIEVIVKSRAGRNWVSTLLTYTLEALLTDPVYGGNKNEAGWRWLQHQPGHPSPPADKTWFHLLQRRHKA